MNRKISLIERRQREAEETRWRPRASTYTSRMASDPTNAAPGQPADGDVQQVDEQEADDERANAVAGHPQQQARGRWPRRSSTATRGDSGTNRGGGHARLDRRTAAGAGRAPSASRPPGRPAIRRPVRRRWTGRARPSSGRLPDVAGPSDDRRRVPRPSRGSAGGWSSPARPMPRPSGPARGRRRVAGGHRGERAAARIGPDADRHVRRSRSARRSPSGMAADGGAARPRPDRAVAAPGASAPPWRPSCPTAGASSTSHDVWLGGPPLAGRVAAADYRIELGRSRRRRGAGRGRRALLAARAAAERERVKGGGTVAYDLRPLLIDLSVVEGDGRRCVVVARTRFHPALGTGRPDEVVAALGDAVGSPLDGRADRAGAPRARRRPRAGVRSRQRAPHD